MRISNTASNPRSFSAPSLYYSSAREGMEDFLRTVVGDSGKKVLLPAYIGWSPREGSGVFDPIRNLGLPHYLYPVNNDLSAQIDAVEAQLRSGDVAVVVLIHYFGRTDPGTEEIARASRRAGAVLVEDLAHGFFSDRIGMRAGQHGDINIYSLHKMLPMPDGGMVQYKDPDLLSCQEETRPELARRVLDYDWRAIAAARVRNFELAVEALRRLSLYGDAFDFVWEFLEGGDVPQTLPLRITKGSRDDLYSLLNAKGVGVVSLYHTLIIEARGKFEDVDRLSQQIINFPVHQDVAPREILHGVRLFGEALAYVTGRPGPS